MKICYLADAGSIHTERWLNYFAGKGYDIHLITLRPPKFSGNNVTFYLLEDKLPTIPLISFPVNLIFNTVQIRRIIKKIKPDILHAHSVSVFGFLAVLSGFHPVISSVWGSDVFIAPKISLVARLIVLYTLKRSDIITTTSDMNKYLEEEFSITPGKIIRIPWGIEIKIFHPGYTRETELLKQKLGIDDGHFILLSNRSLSPVYQIENIIRSIPYVLESCDKITFIFLRGYGSEEYETEMKELAENLGVRDHIRFVTELVTPQEMAVFLNLADAFISIPKTDQFASSVMEGMMCGTIPIVSGIDVYRAYLENYLNALFVNPDSSSDIAETIIFCMRCPDIRQKFSLVNQKIIENNENWELNAEKMYQLYCRISPDSDSRKSR